MKVRKLPVEVEAIQFHGIGAASLDFDLTAEDDGEPPQWLVDAYEAGTIRKATADEAAGVHSGILPEWCIWIVTKEGGHVAKPGDWIIRGIAGELYPCDPAIFAASYEVV